MFNGHTKLIKERESTLRPKVRESSVGKERSERAEEWRDVTQSTTTRTHTFNGGIKGTTEELRKQVGAHLFSSVLFLSSLTTLVISPPSFIFPLSFVERKCGGTAPAGPRPCLRSSLKRTRDARGQDRLAYLPWFHPLSLAFFF